MIRQACHLSSLRLQPTTRIRWRGVLYCSSVRERLPYSPASPLLLKSSGIRQYYRPANVDSADKHMIIATASLQEAILYTSGQYSANRWHFEQHYSKAIALLTGPGANPPVETVLMSCLLFLTCENFQGITIAGLLHIYSGLKIL